MAFRQRLVRRWWNRLNGQARPTPSTDQDPVHYALIISGMMILAFGVLMFGFTTAFALFSR